jgi:hypothetical protein
MAQWIYVVADSYPAGQEIYFSYLIRRFTKWLRKTASETLCWGTVKIYYLFLQYFCQVPDLSLYFPFVENDTESSRGPLWEFWLFTPKPEDGGTSLVGWDKLVVLIRHFCSYSQYLGAISFIRNLTMRHTLLTRHPFNIMLAIIHCLIHTV